MEYLAVIFFRENTEEEKYMFSYISISPICTSTSLIILNK